MKMPSAGPVLLSTILTAAVAAPAQARNPVVVRITDGSSAGPPGKNEGPGAEHATVVQSLVDGKRYVTTVWMSSQVDDSAVPRDEAPYQCKCSTVEIDPTLGPTVVVPPKFITENRGNRPCNHPHMAINPANNQILLAYGTNDPNQANVSPYVQGLDVMCNVLPMGDAGPTQRDREENRLRIDNPNQGGNDGAPWVAVVDGAAGLWQVGYLEDNNRSRTVGVTFKDGAADVLFDKVVIDPAERGRPSVVAFSETRTIVCSSRGVGRPPNGGAACAMFDATTGTKLWEQIVAEAQPNANPPTYYNQPIIVRGENGRYYVLVERSQGNNNGNSRGVSHTLVYTIQPSETGLQNLGALDDIGVHQVHATACGGSFGADGIFHVAVFEASITGSGIAAASLARFDPESALLQKLGSAQALGAYPGDSGYLSNLYGQNPNTQGREFMRCIGDVVNPGFGSAAGFLADVKSFFAFPYTGRVDGEDKNSLFLSLLPAEIPTPVPVELHDVEVNVTGTGIGAVFSNPIGIDRCEGTCSAQFEEGLNVTLTAVAAPGSTFFGWSGACSGTGACTLPIQGDLTVIADFRAGAVDPNNQVGLILTLGGSGRGSVGSNPAGVECNEGTCATNFARNSEVVLTATPAAGSLFVGWGGDCTGTNSTCTVTLSTARTVTATFDVDPNAPSADGAKNNTPTAVSGCAGCSGSGEGRGGISLVALVVACFFLRRSSTRAVALMISATVPVASSGCTAEPPQPVIDAFVSLTPSVPPGTPVELQYTVRDAEGVSIGTVGGVDILPFSTQLNGSVYSAPLIQPTTFIITAYQGDLLATKTTSVLVGAQTPGEGEGEPMPSTQASIVAFAPSTLRIETSASATLTWSTMAAQAGVILANDAVLTTISADDLASGELSVTPAASTVYTLSVSGANGQLVTATTAVNVLDPSVGALTALVLFDSNVKGMLESKCSACHQTGNVAGAPDILGADPNAYYGKITSDPRMLTALPEDSLLLMKDAHAGPAFLPNEKQVVTQWLLAEVEERGLQPNGNSTPTGQFAPRSLSDALTRFGACMQRETWDQTYGRGAQTEAARQVSAEGTCFSCHSSGTAGAFLSANSGDTFDMNRIRPYVMKLVLGTSNADGSFKDLVPAKRYERHGSDGGDHPSYIMASERVQAINDFVDQTLVRFRNYSLDCASP